MHVELIDILALRHARYCGTSPWHTLLTVAMLEFICGFGLLVQCMLLETVVHSAVIYHMARNCNANAVMQGLL